jgi:Tol biopolymer transport system component
MRALVFLVLAGLAATALGQQANPEERHLANVRQLTFGGENAEAYFNWAGDKLVFQSTHPPHKADQIFTMNIDGSDMRLVSTGKGRTTCSYWFPDGENLIYASTHLGGDEPPPPADRSQGYVWPIYGTYDVFRCRADGSDLTRLTDSPGYDAEASVSPDGKKIAYTSVASGDLEIWTMNADGSGKKQITHSLGYDGGPFFSWDGKWICYRSNRPKGAELTQYLDLLHRELVGPFDLDLRIVPADGGEPRTVIELPGSQFCPFFHPDGKRLIFASNHAGSVMEFDLWLVNLDGTGLEQVTYEPSFDGFPMFSHDAKHLVWASNRHGAKMGDTNIYIADWVE